MPALATLTILRDLLKSRPEYLLAGELDLPKVRQDAYDLNPELIALLLKSETLKPLLFTSVAGTEVFRYQYFVDLLTNKEFLPDSFTRFENVIGLQTNDGFLARRQETVLSFPYKDCLLAGGMSKEENKSR